MKAKIAAILAGTMLTVTGGTMSASAAVTSTINQQEIGGQQTTLLLAKNRKKSPPLLRGGRVKDQPGVRFHRVPGTLDSNKLKKSFNTIRKLGESIKKKK